MNIPLASINISEEMNKTGIWKQVNNSNLSKGCDEGRNSKAKSGKKSIKHKKLMSKNFQSEVERRLSTMDEVEEDDSMKSELLKRRNSWSLSGKSECKKNVSAETSV
ncbi:uncharacterized protein LOC123706131 [Colias croceus]|uniref:uncharacterized protein LOC123706131 n=1 Tax=Colias crocea TaxID=72248 RepID=UPI001E279FF3|nr:uncharacterized protein LOC123706131 [Colias croceus]